ncbi:hypothetical protein [Streptomyces sp. NPDC050856]|uniref:hypothetical protein n=1 Tax=Streptomyces sp. NPDC050856 TaxID=3154939 RepID=UPI0033F1A940
MSRRRRLRWGTGTLTTLALCAGAVGGAAGDDGSYAYAFAEDIRPVRGAAATGDAPRLAADATYRDSLGVGGRLVYRVDLAADRHAYVSAVAVPGQGATVSFADGLKVSLRDAGGVVCGAGESRFGAAAFPRPLAAYAHRTLGTGAPSCQRSGPHYVVVERGSGGGAGAAPWALELRHVHEPRLRNTSPPGTWSGAAPTAPGGPADGTDAGDAAGPSGATAPVGPAPAGSASERSGGSGFSDAPALAGGLWTDRVEPGRSRFYRVPVDWGQRISAGVDLAGSPGGRGFVRGALSLTLYNPARGPVGGDDSLSYDGRRGSAVIDPLPPVRYENRFAPGPKESGMRFAGWYYLRVSLSPQVGPRFGDKPYGLTLRIWVSGTPGAAPPYDGPAGIFAVGREDGGAGPGDGAMRVVAAAGIGTGAALVVGLAVWTLLARRRPAR